MTILDFVTKKHGNQKRKYTDEPYVVHLQEVASLMKNHSSFGKVGEYVALCHDLFEDTDCEEEELYEILETWINPTLASIVIATTWELTDRYTPEGWPSLNRTRRKELEAMRLGRCSRLAQTVKCADIISNTPSIVKYDPKFGETYLQEKIDLLDNMKNAEIELYMMACHCVQNLLK